LPIPTDRGYVVVTQDDAGKQTVMIGTKPNNGHPDTVYAMHVSPSGVNVHSEVTMLGSRSRQFTADLAEVYVDDQGIVHIATVDGLNAVTLPA
jgi:hypothetical protein